MAEKFDLLIRNVQLARPKESGTPVRDIAVSGGKFAAVRESIDPASAARVIDGRGLVAFPGLVDAHMHTGIYSPLAEDALTESRAAAQGGVTSSLNYMRSGQYYLNKGGAYAEFFPEVLDISRGRFYVDYAYHLAPMDSGQIGEMEMLVDKFGVTSFKIFMFYGGYGLHGASSHQHDFLMIGPDEKYDIAHFEFVMRGIQAARAARPDLADAISLSLHCETPEIMTAYTKMVEAGVPEGVISALMGHVSRAMMDRYSHVRMEAMRTAVESLSLKPEPKPASFELAKECAKVNKSASVQ